MNPRTLAELESALAASKKLTAQLKAEIRREKLAKARWDGTADTWQPDPSKISREETEVMMRKRTAKGFTRAKLASLGVPWPLPHRWKTRLLAVAVPFHGLGRDRIQEPLMIHRPEHLRDEDARPVRREFKRHVESSPERPPW